MKLNRNLLFVALFAMGSLILNSCGPSVTGRSGESSSTGWEYNSEDWGAFEVVEYTEQETGPGLVLIEGGTFTMGNVEQDVMYDWNSIRRRVTVSSFYMDQTEIRNIDYREYLHWITKVFVDYPEIYARAVPDTLVWRSRLGFNEPYVEYYFRHPAYHDYPVVGVSWSQASEFCIWRTDRVNEKFLIDYGVLDYDPAQLGPENFNTEAYLAGQYTGNAVNYLKNLATGEDRAVKMEDGILLPKYRLPTEAEWEYAALALIGNSVDSPERIYSQRLYPWDGHYVRNDSKESRGIFRANIVRGRGDYMGVAGALNDNAAPTAPVTSYWVNDYGLYCMAGNVNEWVLDVYRPMSSMDMDEFNPFRGNVFETLEKNEDGTYATKNDTTGRLELRTMGTTDLAGKDHTDELDRYNYRTADNINYGDGDGVSSISSTDWLGENQPGSQRMYNWEGKDVTTHESASSLITDDVRVFKGGSWKDRVYWMVPGTRRFLDQDRSTNDIGFRCAMIRVGSPAGQ